MENHNDIDPVDRQHNIKIVNDKIAVIGELEHIRRHALRSCVSISEKAKDEVGEVKEQLDEKSTFYFLTANQATDMRRKYMDKHFSKLADEDWCLCKAAASLRQLMYETDEGDLDLNRVDRFVDGIWGNALGMDLTGCRDCNEDRKGGVMSSPELDDWGKKIVKDLADLSGVMSEEEALNILNNRCKVE